MGLAACARGQLWQGAVVWPWVRLLKRQLREKAVRNLIWAPQHHSGTFLSSDTPPLPFPELLQPCLCLAMHPSDEGPDPPAWLPGLTSDLPRHCDLSSNHWDVLTPVAATGPALLRSLPAVGLCLLWRTLPLPALLPPSAPGLPSPAAQPAPAASWM